MVNSTDSGISDLVNEVKKETKVNLRHNSNVLIASSYLGSLGGEIAGEDFNFIKLYNKDNYLESGSEKEFLDIMLRKAEVCLIINESENEGDAVYICGTGKENKNPLKFLVAEALKAENFNVQTENSLRFTELRDLQDKDIIEVYISKDVTSVLSTDKDVRGKFIKLLRSLIEKYSKSLVLAEVYQIGNKFSSDKVGLSKKVRDSLGVKEGDEVIITSGDLAKICTVCDADDSLEEEGSFKADSTNFIQIPKSIRKDLNIEDKKVKRDSGMYSIKYGRIKIKPLKV